MTTTSQNFTTDFLTSTNITANFCTERRQRFVGISQVGGVAGFSLIITFASIGIIVNICLNFLLYITNQLENRSFRLIFYATMVEILMNISSFCKLPQLVTIPENLPCAYLIAELILTSFSGYGTRYMTCVIAVDRYMRIKYLQNYQVIFSTFWYRVTLGSYLMSVFCICSFHLLSNLSNQPQWIPRVITPLNFIALIIFLTLYIKSYIKLKQHMEESRNLSTTNQDLVKITKFYLIFYLISNLLIMCTSFATSLTKSQNEKRLKQDTTLAFLLANRLNNILTGIVTSLSTLIINRATRAKLSTYTNNIRRRFQLNQVLPFV
ncbi:uncharacterized protein [Clytia hemisphaerica]|uniref:G-protein coupled receptors family 1 profile domain-containing protein n=1 Tax=Clytia hemisphaerica TaxID=252671 RepID=A0A7M5UWK2_9CNID